MKGRDRASPYILQLVRQRNRFQGNKKQQKQSGKCSGVNICPLRNLKQLLCTAEGTLPQNFVPHWILKFQFVQVTLDASGTKAQLSEADVCRCSQLSPCP